MIKMEDILAELRKSQKLHRGAWSDVIYYGRRYGQLVAHGTYEEGDMVHAVQTARLPEYVQLFEMNLLEAVKRATAEDARFGVAVARLTHMALPND